MKNFYLLVFLGVILISFTSAYNLTLYPNPGLSAANTSIVYSFNFTNATNCNIANNLLSYTKNVSINSGGVGFVSIDITNLKQFPTSLCEGKNGVLRAIHSYQTSGSLILNTIFAQNLNLSGNAILKGRLNVTQNITASWFIGKINASRIQNSPWYTKTQINTLNYYNSSDFVITNYYLKSNPFGFWNSTKATFNKTYADTLYSTKAEPLWSGNRTSLYLKSNPFGFWNSTKATFNKTYADTLYSTKAEPLWSGNRTLLYLKSNPFGFYNSSTLVEHDPKWSANSSGVARIGTCPSGQFVQNTTFGGVQCATGAGSGDITSVQGDLYIVNGSDTGNVQLVFNTTYAGLNLNVNRSNYWDNFNVPTDLNNRLTLSILNITGTDSNACTGTDKVKNVTFVNGQLSIVCGTDAGGGGLYADGTYLYNDSTKIYLNATYTSLNLAVNRSNFWDNYNTPASFLWTAGFNATGDTRWLTGGSGEPLWSGNYSLIYFKSNPAKYWNATFATFNKTYADTLYTAKGSNTMKFWNSTFALFNKTYADTLYTAKGSNTMKFWNSTYALFNKTYADTLYSTKAEPLWSGNRTSLYLKSNPFGFWNSTKATFNKTYADTLYSTKAEPLWSGNRTSLYLKSNPFGFWNSTKATFNKTYADTLYSTKAEPLWSGNRTLLVPYTGASSNVVLGAKNLTTTEILKGLYSNATYGNFSYAKINKNIYATYGNFTSIKVTNLFGTYGNFTSIKLTGAAYLANISASSGIKTTSSIFGNKLNITYGNFSEIKVSKNLISVYGNFTSIKATGNVFLATSSGNVGIGTANPKSKLNVIGAFNATSSLTSGVLIAASCDVKSYTNGTLYCGTDATGAGANVKTTTCGGTDKVSAINNVTGVVTCSTDSTGAGAVTYVVATAVSKSTASIAYQNITGLFWTLAASTRYDIECNIIYNASATTIGIGISWDGPKSPLITSGQMISTLSGGQAGGSTNVIGNNTGLTTASSVAVLNSHAIFKGFWSNGANAGRLQMKFAPETATASGIDIKAGSWCKYTTY